MAKCLIEGDKVRYKCPGCKRDHFVEAERWRFNGDVLKPTLSPSVKHSYVHPRSKQEVTTCHYFVKDGNIEFCADCQHALAGQTHPLPDILPDPPYVAEHI